MSRHKAVGRWPLVLLFLIGLGGLGWFLGFPSQLQLAERPAQVARARLGGGSLGAPGVTAVAEAARSRGEESGPAGVTSRGLRLLPSASVPGNRRAVAVFVTMLTAIVSLVLLVACANVSGILLARATAC